MLFCQGWFDTVEEDVPLFLPGTGSDGYMRHEVVRFFLSMLARTIFFNEWYLTKSFGMKNCCPSFCMCTQQLPYLIWKDWVEKLQSVCMYPSWLTLWSNLRIYCKENCASLESEVGTAATLVPSSVRFLCRSSCHTALLIV